ncbi:hypothetical protein Sta7437_4600 (plasmid) [Stanieria cyanosphaera PCC 7437]|uniref:CHAT domain-containing protein n=1 Tax=Stanieria cyanosphaera (strain ATCC 29371 / PCC 7437) TaxID=111780 RepID=K9XZX8_STAC7|nr:hypothetical protein [Stanieria cyanosphaera]AFZ38058.1 hypothetical protein Sta7437_4600 [Stanieria cyanosphaera PCC 7437]
MSYFLEFSNDDGFRAGHNYPEGEVFRVSLKKISPISEEIKKGTLAKNFQLSSNSKSFFAYLQEWKQAIENFRRHQDSKCYAAVTSTQIPSDTLMKMADAVNLASHNLINGMLNWIRHFGNLNSILSYLYDDIIQAYQQDRNRNFCIYIQTDSIDLRQLPWQQAIKQLIRQEAYTQGQNISNLNLSVNFISRFNSGLINQFQRIEFNNTPVRLLTVIGSEIDQSKVNTTIECLKSNNREWLNVIAYRPKKIKELYDKICQDNFDILAFIGHSRTINPDPNNNLNPIGVFDFSSNESFTLKKLENALNTINPSKHKLIIFNSCQSLGFARDLISTLGINNVSCIAYKEVVPDITALDILRELLTQLRHYKNLNMALLKTQLRIFPTEENDGAYAAWFPVICHSGGQGIPLISININNQIQQYNNQIQQYKAFKLTFIKLFFVYINTRRKPIDIIVNRIINLTNTSFPIWILLLMGGYFIISLMFVDRLINLEEQMFIVKTILLFIIFTAILFISYFIRSNWRNINKYLRFLNIIFFVIINIFLVHFLIKPDRVELILLIFKVFISTLFFGMLSAMIKNLRSRAIN